MLVRSMGILVVALGLSVTGTGFAETSTNIDASMEAAQKARAAYRAGRYNEAADGYQRAYQLYPQLSYLEKVAKSYEKDPKLCTQAEEAWRRFIRVCGECDKRTKALRRIEAVTLKCSGGLGPKAPKAARTRFEEGLRLSKSGRWKDAVVSLQTAADLWPNSPRILRELGRASERSGNIQGAIDMYQSVIKLEPKASDISSIQALIVSLKKQVGAQQGYVIIETTPQGASVFVDGTATPHPQKTPVKIPMKPGRHRIELTKDGYRTAQAVVLIEKEKNVRITKGLQPDTVGEEGPWLAWTLGGVGAASIVSGIAFHVSAAQTADEISRVDRTEYDRDADYIKMSQGVAWGGYLVGAALITAAILVTGGEPQQSKSAGRDKGLPMLGWSF